MSTRNHTPLAALGVAAAIALPGCGTLPPPPGPPITEAERAFEASMMLSPPLPAATAGPYGQRGPHFEVLRIPEPPPSPLLEAMRRGVWLGD